MACGSCGVSKNGTKGCSGGCSGGCNRMNTFDWLTDLDIEDWATKELLGIELVEISFKNGARKDFFQNPTHTRTTTGDLVLVEIPGGGGYDVGQISLSGELVRLQMKKKSVKEKSVTLNVIRRANERDTEKLQEIRNAEREVMIRARTIARTLDLDMKVGDVEFQGDGRKATFFYTADGRVDFRELIRHYAKEFKVKIEMRQIGSRQESARVGGLGTCGRELCCSTWLSDFKTVSTAAARYQQMTINQIKLSGACGRLKCCLNYELDTYLDALEEFPDNAERLYLVSGRAYLIKTDVFRGILTYVMETGEDRGKYFMLGIADVKNVLEAIERGETPNDLRNLQIQPGEAKRRRATAANRGNATDDEDDDEYEPEEEYEDVTGAIELRDDKRRKRKRKRNRKKEGNTPKTGAIEAKEAKPEKSEKRTETRTEKPEKSEKTERTEKRQPNKKFEKPNKNEKSEKNEQREKPNFQDRLKKVERPEQQERPERTERPPQRERPERAEKTGTTEGGESADPKDKNPKRDFKKKFKKKPPVKDNKES